MTTLNKNSLAACIAAYLATAAHATCAATVAVTDCGDGAGLGTLRSIITNVVGTPSGSTVDMTACSTITLTAGAITIVQNDLTLLGKSAITTVTAAASLVNDRIFTHTGNATLALDHVSAQHGNLYTSTFANKANGGCISSLGSVTLTDSSISGCVLGSTTYNAEGGGIYAKGALTLSRSSIAENTITHGYGVGGGAFVYGDFTATDSVISGNSSSCNTGGLYLSENVTITGSTISGNHIAAAAIGTRSYGGLRIVGDASHFTASITNSTISGNAAQTAAGIFSSLPLTLNNSTIAFNRAVSVNDNYAAGLTLAASATTVLMQSTLISNNTDIAGKHSDLAIAPAATVTFAGANNLVFAPASGITLPNSPLIGKCPLLGPLQANGGPTLTHALQPHSPAIDAGNNIAVLSFDQRGSPHARELGPADIGAYEAGTKDLDFVYSDDFEGCP